MRIENGGTPTPHDTLITRRVVGDKLSEMFEELGVIAQHEKVRLPCDLEGNVDPRVVLASDNQIMENKEALYPLEFESENLVRRLLPRIPELAEPIPDIPLQSVKRKRISRSRLISLQFEADITERLGGEQEDIWDTLPLIAGADPNNRELKWCPSEPNVLVLALGIKLSPTVADHVEAHIRRRAPFTVTLLPVGAAREPS